MALFLGGRLVGKICSQSTNRFACFVRVFLCFVKAEVVDGIASISNGVAGRKICSARLLK